MEANLYSYDGKERTNGKKNKRERRGKRLTMSTNITKKGRLNVGAKPKKKFSGAEIKL